MKIDSEELYESLFQTAEKILSDGPGCHDFAHVRRVLNNALRIAQSEPPVNLFAIRLGALLHDIARPEELTSNGVLCHAALGATKAAVLMRSAGCTDEPLIELVSDIVRSHRYRGGIPPASLEARIVYDADKLDSLGAFGVARAFHFAGRIGARLHNSADAAMNSKPYSREDSAYREYLVKLCHLPERMLTDTGRAMAKERAAFMHAFFDELKIESADAESEIK